MHFINLNRLLILATFLLLPYLSNGQISNENGINEVNGFKSLKLGMSMYDIMDFGTLELNEGLYRTPSIERAEYFKFTPVDIDLTYVFDKKITWIGLKFKDERIVDISIVVSLTNGDINQLLLDKESLLWKIARSFQEAVGNPEKITLNTVEWQGKSTIIKISGFYFPNDNFAGTEIRFTPSTTPNKGF
jgi:hypothetical protein